MHAMHLCIYHFLCTHTHTHTHTNASKTHQHTLAHTQYLYMYILYIYFFLCVCVCKCSSFFRSIMVILFVNQAAKHCFLVWRWLIEQSRRYQHINHVDLCIKLSITICLSINLCIYLSIHLFVFSFSFLHIETKITYIVRSRWCSDAGPCCRCDSQGRRDQFSRCLNEGGKSSSQDMLPHLKREMA